MAVQIWGVVESVVCDEEGQTMPVGWNAVDVSQIHD